MDSVDPSPMQQLTLVTIRAAGSPLYIDTHIALCLGCSVDQKTSVNSWAEKPQFNTGGLGSGKPQAHSVSQEDAGKWFDTGQLLEATLKSLISFGTLAKNTVTQINASEVLHPNLQWLTAFMHALIKIIICLVNYEGF